MPIESTLSTYVASDGDNIAVQDWPVEPSQALRGVVLIVHGLGEHAGRYDHVARKLNTWGFAVRGYDLYGHGESGGVRGGLPTDERMLDDLADIMDSTTKKLTRGTPLILLGHSMGGMIAGLFVARALRPVSALVMSSPALDPGLSGFQKFLLAVLPGIAPNLRVSNALDVSKISHDPAVVNAYRTDKLIHDRVSARLAKFIAVGAAETMAAAANWKTPTLLMFAGQDKLVAPAGSRAFAATAPQNVVTATCFEPLFHEIFNELEAEPVFAALKNWLDQKFPA